MKQQILVLLILVSLIQTGYFFFDHMFHFLNWCTKLVQRALAAPHAISAPVFFCLLGWISPFLFTHFPLYLLLLATIEDTNIWRIILTRIISFIRKRAAWPFLSNVFEIYGFRFCALKVLGDFTRGEFWFKHPHSCSLVWSK